MVQVIIMAGGMGKRMKSTLPKVLVEFNNKPMIIHVIEEAILLDPNQILVIVGKTTGLLIQETIKEWNIEHFHKIKFVLQDPPLGTGHAILSCLRDLQCDNQTIILSGDVPNIKASTLNECFYLNEKLNFAYILGFIPDNNYGYGRINCNGDTFVNIIEEKECNNNEKKIKLCNTGIYCIPSNLLINYIPNIKNNNSTGEFYLPDVFNFMLHDNKNSIKISTLPKEKNTQVAGINTLEQLKELEKIID